jgi:hypothetical protein
MLYLEVTLSDLQHEFDLARAPNLGIQLLSRRRPPPRFESASPA